MDDQLTPDERSKLLQIARQALQAAVLGELMPPVDLETLPPCLQEPGATFVTLTQHGELRGCIGALEATLSLAEDTIEHAIAAALQDYRFSPVQPEELPEIEIEISRLTTPVLLEYDRPEDLPSRLRPGIDGVVLRDGLYRATFLPQVWEKLPDPEVFLSHLCEKMGAPANLWRYKKLKIYTYQVEEFHE